MPGKTAFIKIPTSAAIAKPDKEFTCYMDVLKAVLEHEKYEMRNNMDEINQLTEYDENIENLQQMVQEINHTELSKEDLTMRLKALAYDNGVVVGKKEPKKFSKDKAKKPLALDVKKDRNPSEWDTLIFKK